MKSKFATECKKLKKRLLTDAVFRTYIALCASFAINLLYTGVNVFSGIIYKTNWFFVLAGYYGILSIMRSMLLNYIRRNKLGSDILSEWKRARTCSAILTLINISLSSVVLMMVLQKKSFMRHGVTMYVIILYTLYITVLAIVNVIKYRKLASPVMTTTKIINLASALVSMLAVEATLLTVFGVNIAEYIKKTFITATGSAVGLILLIMSVYMIFRSTKEIKRIEGEKK